MAALTGTLTSNTTSSVVKPRKDAASSRPMVLVVRGTWGGGTLAVQASADGTNFVPVYESGSAVTIAADGAIGLDLPAGMPCRLSLTGATAPSLTWHIVRDRDL
jgi:hypothetical protein